ncbi:MAG: hypothetical protein EZS28_026275, partial [Streblomastix strix]
MQNEIIHTSIHQQPHVTYLYYVILNLNDCALQMVDDDGDDDLNLFRLFLTDLISSLYSTVLIDLNYGISIIDFIDLQVIEAQLESGIKASTYCAECVALLLLLLFSFTVALNGLSVYGEYQEGVIREEESYADP